jgi:opacity protein-like surface antigen
MRRTFVALVAGVCLTAASSARAADAAKVEVGGGYSFLNDVTSSQSFNGWAASLAGYFGDSLGVAAEVGGNYATVSVVGTSVSLSEYSFMAGPKVVSRHNRKMTPFGQVLLGGVHLSGGVLGFTASETDFAVQPGAGVDVAVTPNMAVRVQGDYRLIRSSGASDNNFRLMLGIVLHQ